MTDRTKKKKPTKPPVKPTEPAQAPALVPPVQAETPVPKPETFQKKPWVGVDLDGTLSMWAGFADGSIGDPVPAMLKRVKDWLAVGMTVKIFTARAADPTLIPGIAAWLTKVGLPALEITNAKDMDMVEFWDDRAVTVVRNTGVAFRPMY